MTLYDELKKDIRYEEGMKACINCGTCTAVCPAAAVSDYDPRQIVDLVQKENEKDLIELLKSDEIWRCGECLSCKTRCPRDNVPCYIIQALRALSIEKGFFIESEQGRRQLAIKRTVGDHILEYGYCVYIDEVSNEMYPEQGPVWQWMRDNRTDVLQRLGASYKQDKAGALRNIDKQSLEDLQKIFDATGGTARFNKIEEASARYAAEHGIEYSKGHDEYFEKYYNGE
jgi:heterodisulfide reductase subunit C